MAQRSVTDLEQQINALADERAEALAALEQVATLGVFSSGRESLDDPHLLLQEIADKARSVAPLDAVALYLDDDDDRDLGMRMCDVPGEAAALDEEVSALIFDQSFAWAVATGRPALFLTRDGRRTLVLHSLSTPSGVRGMFVGRLEPGVVRISDTALALLAVVMLSGAQALESHQFHQRAKAANAELEETVARRTQELVDSARQLRSILASIPAGMVLVDTQTCMIADANPAALSIIGADKDRVVGSICHQFICPAQHGKCPILDLNQEVDNSERILLRADGTEVPVLKTVVPINLRGRDYLLETFVDISEQKKLDSLKEDVERMTRHDLKGPLNGIINLPDLLMEELELDDEQALMLRLIREAGVKMLRMINLSMDLFKMETGTYELNPEPVALLAVIRSILSEMEGALAAHETTVDILLDGQPATDTDSFVVQGEQLLFYSMLSNLITNALEASPMGAVVTVSLDSARHGMSIHNAGAIPEDVRERFFEKYATSGKKKGTGLGTYSAKLIADTLGCDLSFTTSQADGTTLRLACRAGADSG